jgi:hypothetical protein
LCQELYPSKAFAVGAELHRAVIAARHIADMSTPALLRRITRIAALAACLATPAWAQQRLEQIAEFKAPEANQAVGVDAEFFYAIDNFAIGKYEKKTGRLVKRWEGPKDGAIKHMDSALVMGGKIYAAHSNYPEWPMASSLEIFDAATLEHVGTHSFGIQWGSLTWVDWHDGHWWMLFANYDRLLGPGKTPYGHKANTVMIKFTRDFQPLESWTLPKSILDRFEEMSCSGGSWGPDGFLYLSGHDPAEIYKMRLPAAGSVLELVEVLPMNIRGQGIAWDHAQPGVIWGTIRATAKEREAGASHKVTAFRLVGTATPSSPASR